MPHTVEPISIFQPDTRILFQGDSITDAGRDKANKDSPNDRAAFGGGYAWLAAAQLLVERPDDGLKFLNRGVSGNQVTDLASRWQVDCLDLKPDVLRILIGVNDAYQTLAEKIEHRAEKYESNYR